MISPRTRIRLVLSAILTVAAVVRAYHVRWGLPAYFIPDEGLLFVGPALGVARGQSFIPPHFLHPPVLIYLLALVYRGWSLLTGTPLDAGILGWPALLARLTLLGRGVCVVVGTLSVAIVYVLAKHLSGQRAALLAAAAFALAPLPVLESHRINPDGASLLLMLLAALEAVVARKRRSNRPLLAAFALAGLAGAAKYTGIAAATVPAWVVLGWPTAPGRRLGLLAAGGFATLAGFGLGVLPAAFSPRLFVQGLRTLTTYGYVIIPPEAALPGTSWTGVRYLYPLVASLPYMTGWLVYVAALVGLVALLRTHPAAAGVILAALVPYFVAQGTAPYAVARYFQPMEPYLAIAAGAALDLLWRRRRWLGSVTSAVVLGYTALVTVSQVARMDFGPQRAAARLLATQAQATAATGRRLVVAFPWPLALAYDPLGPTVRSSGATVVYFPEAYQGRPLLLTDGAGLLTRDRDWVRRTGIDVLVMPSWIEEGIVRAGPAPPVAGFYQRLLEGRLGLRLAADFHTRFFSESMYVWADPKLEGHFEAGIVGYKVFVRDDE